jgi:hypothetical protein
MHINQSINQSIVRSAITWHMESRIAKLHFKVLDFWERSARILKMYTTRSKVSERVSGRHNKKSTVEMV